MPAMPNRPHAPAQPGLFDPQANAPAPDAAPHADAGPALPLPPFLAADGGPSPAAARAAESRKPPLWARVLGHLLDPWLRLEIEPEQPARFADGRPVC